MFSGLFIYFINRRQLFSLPAVSNALRDECFAYDREDRQGASSLPHIPVEFLMKNHEALTCCGTAYIRLY